MAERRFGVAVIGAGNIAAAHIAAVAGLPQGRLVGVAGRTPEKPRALAEKHGVKAYASVAEAVADPEVEVVAVCTPSGAHLEPAMAAVAAGKHVIVEKPLEISTERARWLIRAAEDAGVALATVFMSRFADANAYVKQAIDAGRLGTLLQGNAYVPWYRTQAYYDSGA
ncbi:MAG TPA: Gfo/Idh/MocA family oxidoreductase, partial [Trueperaceae bacterium]|nr:Gfo/Idh/MocA family oxidoreductase [Trueperaceae bacterium]